MFVDNVILGAGPAGIQLAYYFQQEGIPYVVLEKSGCSASFFAKFPHSKQLISLNKTHTGETDPDFNLRHDWNSLLSDEPCLFSEFSDALYPSSNDLFVYLNEFVRRFSLNIVYNTLVEAIEKTEQGTFVLRTGENQTYTCARLVVASGLSLPYYPENIECPPSVKHYGDYPNGHFVTPETMAQYNNKKVLLIGGGNASYELANLFDKHCSTVLILGSQKKLSIVSHYVGDIRSIYYPFLDSFYLKSLNGVDTFHKDTRLKITQVPDAGTFKVRMAHTLDNYYKSEKLTTFDEVILCTGWKFDKSLFHFDVATTLGGKFPEITEQYESTSCSNLFFVGSLMHSRDYKKGSGGFIHGFRYLLKLFVQLHYKVPFVTKTFPFNGTMDCYNELATHIFRRINYASSIYQLYGVMCDVFYFDSDKRHIVYLHDVTKECLPHLPIQATHINLLFLEYGEQETLISKLGSFNKWNPSFLHPKLYICSFANKTPVVLDRVTFEEDLVADFNTPQTYNKVYQSLKMCNLIL